MNAKQRTFTGELVDPLMLPNDIVETQDNGQQLYADVVTSPDGSFWHDEQAMIEYVDEHNREVFDTFFKQTEEWVDEYHQSDDYISEYFYLLNESSHEVTKRLRKLLTNSATYWKAPMVRCPKGFAAKVFEYLYDYNLIKTSICGQYSSETNGYLDSFEIGECEEQIEVSRVEEQCSEKLWAWDDWDFVDYLTEYLEYNEVTGRNYCLRWKDYDLRKQYATFYLYFNTDNRVDFYIDDDELQTAVVECIVTYCQRADFNRNKLLKWNRYTHRMEHKPTSVHWIGLRRRCRLWN